MKTLYRIDITDQVYAYDGTDSYYVEDPGTFKIFDAVDRESELEIDDPMDFLMNKSVAVSYPHICMASTHVWSNC